MRLWGIRETIEQLKDFLMELDNKETDQSGWDWQHSIAVTTAVIAMIGACVGLFETKKIADMIKSKNDAILEQSKASDQWSHYQAKDIRRHLYMISTKINPRLASEFTQKYKRYSSERITIRQEAEMHVKLSTENDLKSNQNYELHHYCAMSVTAFQVSIALMAVSAYTRSKRLWLFAILISFVGLGCIGLGLLKYPSLFL